MRINSVFYSILITGILIIFTVNIAKSQGNSLSSNTVTDKDGNVYHTFTIGAQTWMVENLKTTKYADGTKINYTKGNTDWNNLTTPAYCWYNSDIAWKNTYGALYNWYAVNTAKLCPTNWHVPTDTEWTIMTSYLGGENVSGGKLKETGNSHWISSNLGATNESGFSALPGGNRIFNGAFDYEGVRGTYWTSTEFDSRTAWQRVMYCNYADVSRSNYYKRFGFSVRCLKD